MPDIQISEKLFHCYIFYQYFLSIAIHEYAHAYFAFKKGDYTAQKLGRLTINPIKHLDLVGSVIMPIMAITSGFMLIGWAKPVPVNKSNFKNPLKDDAVVSVAGPLSNFLLAIVILIFSIVLNKLGIQISETFGKIINFGMYFNIFLFAFNLLPIPPLDGSHILYDLFPNKYTAKLINLGLYGTILLFMFIYSPLWQYFWELVNGIMGILFLIKGF